MSAWKRSKSIAGGGTKYTLTPADGMSVPSDSNLFYLSGSATIGSLYAENQTTANRIVTFYQESGATTFNNNAGSTTRGAMHVDASAESVTTSAADVIRFLLKPNGTWTMIKLTDN